MSDIYTYDEGASCQITHPATRIPAPMPRSLMNNYPAMIKSIMSSKTKAEAGAAMRRFIAWNDIDPELWKKLEDWFPLKK